MFGLILRKLRIEFKMTQKDLAKKLNVAESTISMYERGEREPDMETIEAIADEFNVDISYLYGKSDDLQELPVSNIVFDDYFPLHYCSNLSAGTFQELLDAEPDAVVYVPIKFQNRKKRLKAFKVNGTSMNNLFPNGAVVVTEDNLNNAINYKDGTPVVVLMNNEATVKRIYNQDERLLLVPDSTDKTHLPVAILKDNSQVYVIGKVIYHINPDDIEKYY